MALKTSGDLEITVGALVFSGETEQELEDEGRPKTKREKLSVLLNTVVFQTVVVILVFVDILIITSLMLINLGVIQDPIMTGEGKIQKREADRITQENGTIGSSPVQQAENILHITNLVILAAFLIEVLFRVIGKGWDMIYDRWQIFDCLLVLVVVVLYTSLTGAIHGRTVTYALAYLIILRLWRMARIKRDLTKPVVRHAQRIIVAHRKAVKTTEENNKKLVAKTKSLEREVQSLRDSLQNLSIVSSRSGLPQSPVARSHMSLDTVASEDELERSGYYEPYVRHETVAVEVLSPHRRYTPHGGPLMVGTPRGSVGSFPNGSQPGTPLSCTSSVYAFDNMDGVVSDGSSGKIPDIVEDTQQHAVLTRSGSREGAAEDMCGMPPGLGGETEVTADGVFSIGGVDSPALAAGKWNNGPMNASALGVGAAYGDGAISFDESVLLAKDYADFANELSESGIFPGSSIPNSETNLPVRGNAAPPPTRERLEFVPSMDCPDPVPFISESVSPFLPAAPRDRYSVPDYDGPTWPGTASPVWPEAPSTVPLPVPPPVPPPSLPTAVPPPVPYDVTPPPPPRPEVDLARSTSPGPFASVAGEAQVEPLSDQVEHVVCPSMVVLRDKSTISTHNREHTKEDTVQLIKDHIRSKEDFTAEDFSYLNAAFGSLTEEELNEIRRVSQVPFEYGSISVLTKEGIPMTDL